MPDVQTQQPEHAWLRRLTEPHLDRLTDAFPEAAQDPNQPESEDMLNPNDTKRIFVALQLWPEFTAVSIARKNSLLSAMRKLGGGVDLDTEHERDGLHIMLRFLGDVQVKELKPLVAALNVMVGSHRPMMLHHKGAGVFNDADGHPEVLYLGLGGEVDRLQRLQEDVERTLHGLGYEPDRGEFVPHIALCRLKSGDPEQRDKIGHWWTEEYAVRPGQGPPTLRVVQHMQVYRAEWREQPYRRTDRVAVGKVVPLNHNLLQ